MLIQITQTNKKNKLKRTWSFLVEFDYFQFKFANMNNSIEFCRFNEEDSKGIQTKYYDITSKQYNCSWKEAEPSQLIIDKVLKKIQDSWTIKIKKGKK